MKPKIRPIDNNHYEDIGDLDEHIYEDLDEIWPQIGHTSAIEKIKNEVTPYLERFMSKTNRSSGSLSRSSSCNSQATPPQPIYPKMNTANDPNSQFYQLPLTEIPSPPNCSYLEPKGGSKIELVTQKQVKIQNFVSRLNCNHFERDAVILCLKGHT